MKYLVVLLLSYFFSFSQERNIKGYVYFEDEFIPIQDVEIIDLNNKLITKTDSKGYFNFKLNDFNSTFYIKYPGLQEEIVEVIDDSDKTFIFMFTDPFIDFVSIKKAQRIIKRDKKRLLKKVYPEAIKRGIIPENTLYNKQKLINIE